MTSAIIVTAANNTFYRTLYQFLLSIKRHKIEKKNTILIYDLGLLPHQLEKLKKHFLSPSFKFRHFKVTGKIETFYWKPIIISNVLQEYNIPVLWLDSATVILQSLDPIIKTIKQTGLYTPIASMEQFSNRLHSGTINYLNIPPEFLKKRNRAGGYCGFNPNHDTVIQLVNEWNELSQVPNCISPKGATSQNHRYDQALLTYLLYHYENKGKITLIHDELDISSIRPTPYTRTRNKVPNYIPIWLDSITRIYFFIYHILDIFILKCEHKLTK